MSDYQQEIISSIALSHLPHVSLVAAKRIYEEVGSASLLFEHRAHLTDLVPDAAPALIDALKQCDEALRLAEKEMEYIQQKRIKAYVMNDPLYPQRLLECNDAPLVVFFCGNADFNSHHVINIVGTRRCTQYGKDICREFISDLKRECPDIMIVSGLAYGIDIHAHRAALQNGMTTVGVLAHGLDRIRALIAWGANSYSVLLNIDHLHNENNLRWAAVSGRELSAGNSGFLSW